MPQPSGESCAPPSRPQFSHFHPAWIEQALFCGVCVVQTRQRGDQTLAGCRPVDQHSDSTCDSVGSCTPFVVLVLTPYLLTSCKLTRGCWTESQDDRWRRQWVDAEAGVACAPHCHPAKCPCRQHEVNQSGIDPATTSICCTPFPCGLPSLHANLQHPASAACLCLPPMMRQLLLHTLSAPAHPLTTKLADFSEACKWHKLWSGVHSCTRNCQKAMMIETHNLVYNTLSTSYAEHISPLSEPSKLLCIVKTAACCWPMMILTN